MTEIHGEVARGFEAVRTAFTDNFDHHGDVGAAFALYVKGRKVADLWGGVADETTGRPWDEDTLQLVFSTTKGWTAACAHLLVQRDELDLDAPVTEYWPEFGAEGKQSVPVRWLLSHRVGLPVVDTPLTPEQVLAWGPIVEALAAQRPIWEPGTAHGYHGLTYGWLVGEVVKRISGKSVGTFLADEFAKPLALDLWVGLPAAEERRVSRLIELQRMTADSLPPEQLAALPDAVKAIIAAASDPDSLMNRMLTISTPPLAFNDPAVHAAEVPAANGITDARSLARFYASLVSEVDGVRLLEPPTIDNAIAEQSNGVDRCLLVPTRFGLGYMLDSGFAPLFGPRSFGHPGAGGSLGFADPDSEVAFGYVMNKMQQNLAGDPRTLTLIQAVRDSL